MSGELVAWTCALGFLVYAIYATRLRSRVSRGRRMVARAGGIAQWSPYGVFVPYVVIALRPGPELPVPDAVRGVGLALVVAGIGFSLWAARTLGRHFDMEVEIHEGHEVVDRGPFAIVRHPVYLGLAVHFIGACLATGNGLLILGRCSCRSPRFTCGRRRRSGCSGRSSVRPTTRTPRACRCSSPGCSGLDDAAARQSAFSSSAARSREAIVASSLTAMSSS